MNHENQHYSRRPHHGSFCLAYESESQLADIEGASLKSGVAVAVF